MYAGLSPFVRFSKDVRLEEEGFCIGHGGAADMTGIGRGFRAQSRHHKTSEDSQKDHNLFIMRPLSTVVQAQSLHILEPLCTERHGLALAVSKAFTRDLKVSGVTY